MQQNLQILADSFSIVGTKRLTFTDDPDRFIQFSDTGGILGKPVERSRSFEDFHRNSDSLVVPKFNVPGEHPKLFIGHIRFSANEFAVFSSTSDKLLRLVLQWWNQPDVLRIWFPAKAKAAEIASFKESLTSQTNGQSLWDIDMLADAFFDKGFLPIRLERNGQRLLIHVLNCRSAELPLSSVVFSRHGNLLECGNRLLIENKPLTGFTIQFSNQEIARTYLDKSGLAEIALETEQISANQKTFVGLIGQVEVEGLIKGCAVAKSLCDARLDTTSLTILDQASGAELCAFDLTSEQLAVDGTGEGFIVSSDYSTTIRIVSESKDFLLAVYQNSALQAAAARSSYYGPFIANNTQQFVRIEDRDRDVMFSVDGSEPSPIEDNIPEPTLSTRPKPIVKLGDYEFHAELPCLEGIHATLKRLKLRAMVAANFAEAIAELIGFEGRYLTFCAFGTFAHAHILISKALELNPSISLATLTRSQDKEGFLAIIAQYAGMLTRECETIFHYFPQFVVEQDSNALSSAGLLDRLDVSRAVNYYHSALQAYGSITSHLYRIENTLARLESVRKASLKSESWAPLGVSLAASLVSPFALIAAAQQGVSLASRESAKGSFVTETLNDVFDTCAREWDFLTQTLVPCLSARFAQEVYPVRLAIANILLKAYDEGDSELRAKLTDVIAQRLGRLMTFCEFPSNSSVEVSRSACVEFLFQSQKQARGIEQRPF